MDDRGVTKDMIRLRMENAYEFLEEAEELLHLQKYKGANNRSYYAMEKAVKALLLSKGVDSNTHNGNMVNFNRLFIYEGDGYFTREDYAIYSKAETIRSASDYNDFYIADKQETLKLVKDARTLIDKIESYLATDKINS